MNKKGRTIKIGSSNESNINFSFLLLGQKRKTAKHSLLII